MNEDKYLKKLSDDLFDLVKECSKNLNMDEVSMVLIALLAHLHKKLGSDEETTYENLNFELKETIRMTYED